MRKLRTSDRISHATWEALAKSDPWNAVLTTVDGRAIAIDAAAHEAFYATGEAHVARIFSANEAHFGIAQFDTAADFGCGVGRLTIPLARRCKAVVGADIAPTMLALAAERARVHNVANVTFQPSDAFLDDDRGFDLFHSFLVFQHIWPKDGMRILGSVVPRVRQGGVIALHLPYWVGGRPPRYAFRWARTHIPSFNAVANVIRGVPAKTPFMQMNAYDLNRIIGLLHDDGFEEIVLLREREDEAHSVILLGLRQLPSPATDRAGL